MSRSEGDGNRTRNLRIDSPVGYSVTEEPTEVCNAPPTNNSRFNNSQQQNQQLDVYLEDLIDAWPTLPGPVKAGIKAMVEAVRASK